MKKYPVSEIFGPTIQGEGKYQGVPAYFVRFGGCDFRCDWCDTPHAVLPQAVRANERLTSIEIIDRLHALPPGPAWVVITGGNPALHELGGFVDCLEQNAYMTMVETQGTRWREWLMDVDSLCLSPKPPSSGMDTKMVEEKLDAFLAQANGASYFFKIVVFDQQDYEWAKKIHARYFFADLYLSAGNDAGMTVGNPSRVDTRTSEQVATDLLNKGRWLTNRVMVDPAMQDVRVQAQQHVLLWGNERGH